jgi:oligopeptidase B
MKKLTTALIQLSLLSSLVTTAAGRAISMQDAAGIRPPVAKRVPKTTEIHGYKLVDDYFWLREKSSPEVLKYLEAENAYTEAMMKPTARFQEALYREILGRVKETDVEVPYRYGDYFYYSRTEKGKDHPILCRKRAGDAAREEVTLDLNELARGGEINLGAYVVSDDGNYLAYSIETTGYLQFSLYVKDLRTGKLLGERIERVGNVVWSNDNRNLFYTTEDPVNKRSDKFWRHTAGTDKKILLYEEKDELFDISVHRSRDKKMILLGCQSKTSSEWRYLPASDANAELKTLWPREEDHEYDVDYDSGQFYFRTNKSAKNFRVLAAPENDPRPEKLREFIAHRPAAKIEDLAFFDGYSVVTEREGGIAHLRAIDLRTGESRRIGVPEEVYNVYLDVDNYSWSEFDRNPEYNISGIRYRYESMITPGSVFEFDLKKGQSTLLKQQEVPGGYDRRRYVTERVWATARDGARVPLSLVYAKGVKLDGTAPLLLNGYGSYGASLDPGFSSARLSLLDRGVIFAVAHVRGGGEMGEEWREQGRMMKKMNTFTDFIDSAQWLIENRYTSARRLAITGLSAGGLLMGAVTNMRPDLFKAVVAEVPFVDAINTMLDASLPLTTSEYLEWGNPAQKAAFDYIMRYSPYDNVKAQDYPAMLVEVSFNDSQVPYWEGAKLVAKLRALKRDNNPLLLRTEMEAGHSGPTGRYDLWRKTAFRYAFILTQIGIKK